MDKANRINIGDLINIVSAKTRQTKLVTEDIIHATFKAIEDELTAGRQVNIISFGKFEAKERNERTGRNPKTKEPVLIAARKRVKFTASDLLNSKVDHTDNIGIMVKHMRELGCTEDHISQLVHSMREGTCFSPTSPVRAKEIARKQCRITKAAGKQSTLPDD